MKTVPTHDETMRLLSGVTATYSWTQFKPILHDPERLKAWIKQTIAPAEGLGPDEEQEAFNLWTELTPEEREMFKTAFLALWGKEGAQTLPMNLDQ
jgi:hypothetical protein